MQFRSFTFNDINDMIKFTPDSGSVSIKEDRVVLFQVKALNQLKEELIKTLGEDIARGIIMRSGFRCGFHDAQTVTKTFGLETKWLSLGPIMYRWKGLGQVEIETVLECDKDSKSYSLKGKWINSQEAEHYLNAFGIATQPICWMSSGYASGFATGFLGYEVYCHEITCVGKGDPYCSWEMRSRDGWGDRRRFFLDLYNPKFEFKDLQTLLLEERSNEIHRKLTELVLEGRGIQIIAETLTEIIGSPVLVLNQYLNIVGNSYKKTSITDIDNNNFKYVREHYIKKLWNKLAAQQKILTVGPFPDIGFDAILLLSPIIAAAKIKGLLVVEKKDPTYLDIRAIEHACTVCALELIKEEAALEAEIRIKGDFFDDLLTVNPDNYEKIDNMAKRLGYNFREPHSVMIVDIADKNKNDFSFQDILPNIKNNVKFLVDKYAPQSLITLNGNQVVLVIRLAQLKINETELAKKITSTISVNYSKYVTLIGLGRECSEYKDYKKSYEDATFCIEIMRKSGDDNCVRTFDDLGVYGILCDLQKPDRLKNFCLSHLGALINYDKSKGTNLLDTLELYFSSNCSLKKTAETAYIHISSLKYRLKRIEKLTEKDLNKDEDRFNLQLSLRILQSLNS